MYSEEFMAYLAAYQKEEKSRLRMKNHLFYDMVKSHIKNGLILNG